MPETCKLKSQTSESISARFLNVAAYKFVPLNDLRTRRRELKAACDMAGLRGTILLSREGINLFIAGDEFQLRGFLKSLTNVPEFTELDIKESWSDHQPFNRMLVRLKAEIISLGVEGIDPANRPSPKLSPTELKQWLDEGREITLLDVRNDYEVGVGSFIGARAIGLDHFRNFPTAVTTLPEEIKKQPIVMFCTGGIRCEKAGPYMQQHGFQNIFQLDGGILKYFEDCGGAHYEGDCFVFDKRVAVGPDLQESGLAMCFVCQAILSPDDQASPHYVAEKSCPHCYRDARPTLEHRTQLIRDAMTPLPGSVAYDNMRPIRIPANLDGADMLTCVAFLYPHKDHEYWLQEFQSGFVRLGDKVATSTTIVRAGQRYAHWFPNTVEPEVSSQITVIYEDDALLVVNKPAPLPMHPSGRFNRNTLVWMLRHAMSMHGLRPVHRLDANTTGVAIFAKSRSIAGELQRQFDECVVKKTYLVQCHGIPNDERFNCTAPISQFRSMAGGRVIAGEETPKSQAAETNFVRLKVFADQTSLVKAHPITGRTNQIRLHLWHLGCPIVGDPLYLTEGRVGDSQTLDVLTAAHEPMRLHAWKVEFKHPQSKQRIELVASTPAWFRADASEITV